MTHVTWLIVSCTHVTWRIGWCTHVTWLICKWHMWHDSSLRVQMCIDSFANDTCDMTHWCHSVTWLLASCTHVTWRIVPCTHVTWLVSKWHMWHDSLMSQCDMTHLRVTRQQEPVTCDMAQSHVYMSHTSRTCHMTQLHVTWLNSMWHNSLVGVVGKCSLITWDTGKQCQSMSWRIFFLVFRIRFLFKVLSESILGIKDTGKQCQPCPDENQTSFRFLVCVRRCLIVWSASSASEKKL